MPAEHALLSASASHRWLNCPPSARLEVQLLENTSDCAEEGRLAHEIAELKLRKYFVEPMGTRSFNSRFKKLKENKFYQGEMLDHTDTYLEYIQGVVYGYSNKPHVAVERRLDYSHIAPEGFGTGDCIILGEDTLYIIDFKYGKGVPVSAEDNPQMKLYALGALKEYSMLYCVNCVKMVIVQPRLNSVSEFEMPVDELLAWGEEIKSVAQLAYDGKGEFNAGDWCRFCKARAQCRARTETMTALEAFGYLKPPLIANEEVGEILVKAQHLKSWASDIEGYALSALLKGDSVPGWKAVEGRSTRQFDNTDNAFDTVKSAGYDEAVLYERKPITLTSVEKLLGKAKFTELLGPNVIKQPGKPTLAPESDKREPINLKITAAEAFNDIKGEM